MLAAQVNIDHHETSPLSSCFPLGLLGLWDRFK